MASVNPIVLPGEVMLMQSLSYLEHDLAHDLHPAMGGKDSKDKDGNFSGRMQELSKRLTPDELQFLKSNRKLKGGRKIIQKGGNTTPEDVEVKVLYGLADKFIQEGSLFATDVSRRQGAVIHFFFILWPHDLNKKGQTGKIYISNVDPNSVNVYDVVVDTITDPMGNPALKVVIANPSPAFQVYGNEITLIKTRSCCPEQYQLILNGATANPAGPITFIQPNPDTLYSPAAYESLAIQQGVLGNYLLDTFFPVNGGVMGGGSRVEKKKSYIGGMSSMATEPAMKINLAYIVCMAASCHRYAWNKVIQKRYPGGGLPATPFAEAVRQEADMLNTMAKSAQDGTKGSTGVGNIDVKLGNILSGVIYKTKFQGGSNYFSTPGKFPYDGKNTLLLDIIRQNPENGSKYTSLFNRLKNEGKKYYLNNAVPKSPYIFNSPLNNIFDVVPYFCESSSIMDGQSTCNTFSSADNPKSNGLSDGVLLGNQIYTITDAPSLSFDTSTPIPSGSAITYNIYVQTDKTQKVCRIHANYQCGDIILVNIGDGGGIASWPKNPAGRTAALDISLESSSTPLGAVECYYALSQTVMDVYNTTNLGFFDILQGLRNSDSPDWTPMRTGILNIAVRKSLGDVLQELSAAADGGGYVPTTEQIYPPKPGGTIAAPNEGRLMLSNDRPSGFRALLYVLYGLRGINPNVLTGYLHPPQQPGQKGEFYLAGRTSETFSKDVEQAYTESISKLTGGKYRKSKKEKSKKRKSKKEKPKKRKTKREKKKNKKTRKK